MPGTSDDWRPWAAERLRELQACLLFLTQIPLARIAPMHGASGTSGDATSDAAQTPSGHVTLAQASWAFPLAGVLVGAIGAIVYALAHRLGLPPWPAAALTVAATLAVTGALHEDGFADTADGFGGGKTPEQKLAIMRDTRIGTYGACALMLSLVLRAAALASLADSGAVAAALIAAHAGARAVMPAVMHFLPPARSDGLSFAAGAPSIGRVAVAAVLALIVLLISLGLVLTIAAAVMVAIAVALMAGLSERQIGGQTGDVLGAVEQVCEIVVLLVALK